MSEGYYCGIAVVSKTCILTCTLTLWKLLFSRFRQVVWTYAVWPSPHLWKRPETKCLSHGFYIFVIFGYSWEKLEHILSAESFIFADFFCCSSWLKWRHSRNLLITKTHSYRHTENISLDSGSNRYYSMKINRNSQTYGVFVY